MKPPRAPLFLERETYRRRRLMDAGRILPVVGFVALLLPVLWTRSGRMGTAGEMVYIFALWPLLVLAAAALSGPLRAALRRERSRADLAGTDLAGTEGAGGGGEGGPEA